jgi:hypothetical protein
LFPPFRASYLGAGAVIGTNAVIHMVIAQGVALGFLGFLGLADLYALRYGGNAVAEWERLLKRLLTFGTVVTTVAGAVTGAGIWFTIGALSPRATASMLRIFFWPWFAEWLVFVVEVVAILLLYGAWDWLFRWRWLRIALAFAYAGYSVLSAILITGIIGFMLTSGKWPGDERLVTAFFNPSFLPQLLSRLALAGVAGSIIALGIVALPGPDAQVRRAIARPFGAALLICIAVLIPALAWYLLVVPDFYTTRKVFAVLTQHSAQRPSVFYLGNLVAGLIAVALAVAALARRTRAVAWLSIPALLAVVGFIAEFERIREFIRGPYLMPGHMYASEVLMAERFLFEKQGMLPDDYWYQRLHPNADLNQAGAQLFNNNCAICHTAEGINDIRKRVAGRTQDGLEVLLDRTHELVSFMPPFSGDSLERRVTARFLYRLGQRRVDMQSHSRVVVAKGAPP